MAVQSPGCAKQSNQTTELVKIDFAVKERIFSPSVKIKYDNSILLEARWISEAGYIVVTVNHKQERAEGGERSYGHGHPKSEIKKIKCCNYLLFALKSTNTCCMDFLVCQDQLLRFSKFKCLHFSHSPTLEFGRGAYNQAVAPGITWPHAPGLKAFWTLSLTSQGWYNCNIIANPRHCYFRSCVCVQ